jgi:C-terminal processing protease CtpA/Prc
MRKGPMESWMPGARTLGLAALLAAAFMAAATGVRGQEPGSAQAEDRARAEVQQARTEALMDEILARMAQAEARMAQARERMAEAQAQSAEARRGQVAQARERMAEHAPRLEEALARAQEARARADTLRTRAMTGVRIVSLDRPRIGISMEPDPDRPGVLRVVEVMPNSGAREAGIQVGDRILAVEDEPLPAEGADAAEALVERVQAHEVGDTLRLRIDRQGEILEIPVELTSPWPTVRVVGADPSVVTLFRGGEIARLPGAEEGRPAPEVRLLAPRGQAVAPEVRLRTPRVEVLRPGQGERLPWVVEGSELIRTQGMRTTRMNPGLAGYFGVDAGALVLELGPRSPEGLREGDVITGVDGRQVESPADLGRILGSYRSGESLTFQVWREGAAREIGWTVP